MSTIWSALLEAQTHADALTKTGRNTAQGWSFVTVEAVTRIAREALNKAGLVAFLRLHDGGLDERTLNTYLVLIHPATGQEAHFPAPWPVERAGPQARRAAFAYARKQALMELLALSEPDPETDAKPAQKLPPKRVKIAAPPPAATGDETAGGADTEPTPDMITRGQLKHLNTLLTDIDRDMTRDQRRDLVRQQLQLDELVSSNDLTMAQATTAISGLISLLAERRSET